MRNDQATGKDLRTGDSAVRGYTRRRAALDTRLGEPCVWTERMLTTLEQGVRGGRWHTLIDKVYTPLNLFAASASVIGNQGAAGMDHQTVESFAANRVNELDRLHESLRTDSYRPQAVQRVWIPKPGSKEQRPLGVPTCVTAWCKPRCCTCWNRSSTPHSRRTATAFDTAGDVIMPGMGREAAD